MKYLSKLLSMLLVGAMLYSTGCTDYETDIKNLENKVDKIEQDLKADYDGKINSLSANLTDTKKALEALIESEIAALAAEHDADIKALEDAYKKADSALEQSLQGKIDAANAAILALQGELDKEVAALESEIDALETALAQAKKEAQDADAALKAELLKEITNLETELLAKITELQTKLEGDIEALRDDMQAKVDAANDAITKAQGEIDALDIRVGQTETDIQAINTEIDTLNNMLTVAKAELEAADLKLAQDLAEAKAELAKAIADGDAALAASLEKAITDLTAQNEALKNSLEAQIAALENQLNAKIEQLEAQDLLFVQQIAALASDLSALEDLVDARYEELVASLATLETKLQAQIDQNKRDIAQNAANIDKVVNDLAETKSDLAKLTDSVANLEILLVKNYEEFTNFKAIMEGQIAALEASLVLLQSSYDEIVNELIPGLNEQISKNEALINSTIADLAKNEAIFNAYREATNNTLDLLMKTDAALQTVLSSVCDDVESLQGELATLTSAIADAQAACQEQLANCYAYINEVAADFGSKYNSLASMQAAQQAQMEMIFAKMTAYEAYFTSVNQNLQKEIDERKSEDRRISVALTELASKYDELESKYDARCNELAANIVELATDFAEYKVQVEHALDALLLVLRQEIAAALNSANEYTDEQIEMLDAKLTEQLNQAVIDLKTRITGVETELKALVKKTEDQLRQEMTEIKYDLNEHIQNILASLEKVNGRLDGAENRLDEAEGRITLAEEKIQENFELFLDEVNSIRAELTNINTRIDEVNSSLGGLREDFEDFVKKTEAALVTLRNDLTTLINNQIVKLRDDLEEKINEIVNRAQSIVFVPKYTDGKGTINYAKAGDAIVESRSQAEYQVYPASCADAIVASFKPEKPILTFDSEYLQTRSTALSFNIVAVKALKDENNNSTGRIVVTFEPRGLDEKFYTDPEAKTEYALSLHLNTEKVNLSSPYTNFVRAKKFDDITMAIYDGDEVVSSTDVPHMTHKFDYNNIEATVEVLPNHILKYAIGDKLYTEQELNDAGYALSSERIDIAERAYDPQNKGGIDPFKWELVNNIINVSVNVVDNSLIGNPVKFGYKYVAGGLETVAFDYAVTTPVIAKIGFAGQATTWNYTDDAAVDAAFFANENQTEKVYSRSFPLNLANDVLSETLPKDAEGNYDLTVLDVLKYQGTVVKEPVVKVYNVATSKYEVVENVDAEFVVDADDNVKFNFSGFEWNKKYEVVVTYSLHRVAGEPFLTVDVTTFVETTGRPKDTITINLAEEQWMLTKNFLYESKTAPETLSAVSDRYEGFLGKETPESFLKDIFVNENHKFVASENLANDKAEENTKLVIVNDGAAVESVYNINDYAVIPEAIEYVYNITTWYGQEIVITKKLNIGLTPVEIKLAEVPVKLVKDLAFYTEAESLVEIYNLVGNVDKANITADEYLFAIFAEPKFRALRAQKDLANGVELANTKLVVAPKDGATAKAAYDYIDFATTPKQVVYKSTFTTWYGQEITINKTVNIDWTTYNYIAIPEWVYNLNTPKPYSIAIPYRINSTDNDKCLEEMDIELNMNTAFKVVDADGNNVSDKLAALGLTSKFDFSKQPVDSGIKFDEGTNLLKYHGIDKTVGIKAQLTLTNTGGVETVLPTNFDEGQIYANYYVKQYNPVGVLSKDNLEIRVANTGKKYTYYIKNQLQITDDRGYDLIKHGDLEIDTESEIKYANADWVVGDGVANGFANGVSVSKIYGLEFVDFEIEGIPADLASVLKFNTTTGELSFDNTNNIKLTETKTLYITARIKHTWASADDAHNKVKITVKILKNS